MNSLTLLSCSWMNQIFRKTGDPWDHSPTLYDTDRDRS